tara:strand:- start:89 stop:679 length:591 start_codon:yes stop_codon:yes gene_type:complete
MVEKREAFAPWSLTREAGVQSATVNGTIDVPQVVQPILSTGFVDYKGNWQGAKSSDEQFFGITTHLGVANGGATLSPATGNVDYIDMTGFTDLMIAMKPSAAGNYAIVAVMGPDTNSFANLAPVATGESLRGNSFPASTDDIAQLLNQSTEAFDIADAWKIVYIHSRLKGQKNLQIKITNNTGGASDMEVAFMRLI